MPYEVIQGDCIGVLKGLDNSTFDSIVTDPPYALSFMGKDWDSFGNGLGYQTWCEQWARECLRVLKPGGYLLAFGGTRTYHRLTTAIEDAGFEIRDSLHWIYGSGFPKSMDVSKAIDKAAGAERQPSGAPTSLACEYVRRGETCKGHGDGTEDCQSGSTIHALPTAPATAAAETWAGWGTALKPAHEPIVVARKPLAAKTVTANVLEHGTGAINIAGCRLVTRGCTCMGGLPIVPLDLGRWPPNVMLSDEAAEEMDRQSGTLKSGNRKAGTYGLMGYRYGDEPTQAEMPQVIGDSGGASRFFPCFKYQAKASKKERPVVDGIPAHPTVKPIALMQWLVRLVTPQGGYVLDPFAGTGTTAEACWLESFDCLLIERDSDSIRRIEKRMSKYETEAA